MEFRGGRGSGERFAFLRILVAPAKEEPPPASRHPPLPSTIPAFVLRLTGIGEQLISLGTDNPITRRQ